MHKPTCELAKPLQNQSQTITANFIDCHNRRKWHPFSKKYIWQNFCGEIVGSLFFKKIIKTDIQMLVLHNLSSFTYLLLPWSQSRMKIVHKSQSGWLLCSGNSLLTLLFLETTASSYSALWNRLQFILEAREGRTCLMLVQGLEFSKLIQLRVWSSRHHSKLRWEAQLWLALNYFFYIKEDKCEWFDPDWFILVH